MWIKICGMTTPAAVDAAMAAGVQAIGFVFARSVRELSIARANELAHAVRGRIECVAVFRDAEPAMVSDVLEGFVPDVLQAYAESLHAYAAARSLPRALRLLPVLRSGHPLPPSLPPSILYEGPVSGEGVTGDWSEAARLAERTELVLAGGLCAKNVAEAIRTVRPFGIDVSSGVESAPGVKSVSKIGEFVSAAMRATMENA